MSDPSTAAANALGASVAPPPPPKEDGTPQPVATGRMCTNGCGKQAGTLECPKCQALVLVLVGLLLLPGEGSEEGSPSDKVRPTWVAAAVGHSSGLQASQETAYLIVDTVLPSCHPATPLLSGRPQH